jgi:hypothetical protein
MIAIENRTSCNINTDRYVESVQEILYEHLLAYDYIQGEIVERRGDRTASDIDRGGSERQQPRCSREERL